MAEVVLRGITKSFGELEVIHGVDLDVAAGEFVVLVGPSGCGKSTLLRLIAGLEDISAGDLFIDGVSAKMLPPAKRGVAMVFQSYALYPHMTAYENMAFGLRLARAGRAEIETRVLRVAKLLQIDHLLDRKPGVLSGGQRQRVAIGRAIVREPKVFLFDEPLSNLDAALRVRMRVEIATLHHDLKATMIHVTHDQVEAMTLAEKIVVLNCGRIEQIGAPLELYGQPRNLFVAGFIGSPKMNFIECRLAGADAAGATVALPDGVMVRIAVDARGASSGQELTLGIRPEHLTPADADKSDIAGRVALVERLGDEAFVHVETAGTKEGLLVARLPANSPVKRGDTMRFAVPESEAHLFDAEGMALMRLPVRSGHVAGAPVAGAAAGAATSQSAASP